MRPLICHGTGDVRIEMLADPLVLSRHGCVFALSPHGACSHD